MATKIEWARNPDGSAGETWNPIRARNLATSRSGRGAGSGIGHFCEHVSEGCRNCYAERMQPRFGNPIRYAAQDRGKVDIFLDETVLFEPLGWRKPRTIFPCSMTDLFGRWVPDRWIDQVFAVAALCPQHTLQVLTKRPERMLAYANCPDRGAAVWDVADAIACREGLAEHHPSAQYLDAGKAAAPWPLPNVWLGVSAEDQATADARIPLLLDTPAAVRFMSYEPALGPVLLDPAWIVPFGPTLDWLICGGESGPGARPMHPDWARSARDQCADAGVAFFFKQWGRWAPAARHPKRVFVYRDGGMDIPDYRVAESDHGEVAMAPVGKKRAGRVLDGRVHDEMPAAFARAGLPSVPTARAGAPA